MKYCLDDTIVAIASAQGTAARGIIRLSGPYVVRILVSCFVADDEASVSSLLQSTLLQGRLTLDSLRSLPCTLHLWPTNRSYTRQPAAEIHTLGSPPLLSLALKAVCSAGARLAEPGEFTLRAFLAGRVDLTQAEAVLGVIDAQDQRQLDISLAQMAGGIAEPLQELRGRLIDLLADLEAGLDFVEEDIHFIAADQIEAELRGAVDTLCSVLMQITLRATRTDLPRVVLIGAPNAGKSSLFNALAESEAAIVSDTPGTTRDYLTVRLTLGGLAYELVDTAGVDDLPQQTIEQVAQHLGRGQADRADLRLVCVDASESNSTSEDHQLNGSHNELLVYTKCDRVDGLTQTSALQTSSITGFGLPELKSAVAARLQQLGNGESCVVQATAQRCEGSLRSALQAIETAQELNRQGSGEEFVAAEIRSALDELGRVVGAVYTDDLLDRIFSRFCIGK